MYKNTSIKNLIIEGLSIKPITEKQIKEKTDLIFTDAIKQKIQADLIKDVKKIMRCKNNE